MQFSVNLATEHNPGFLRNFEHKLPDFFKTFFWIV